MKTSLGGFYLVVFTVGRLQVDTLI